MRFSIRVWVLVVPAIIAILCGWIASNRRAKQSLEIEYYQMAVESGRPASPKGLVDTLGIARAREVVIHELPASADIIFDADRWLQILRVPEAFQVGEGDGYSAYTMGAIGITSWTLPKGTVLKSVHFSGEKIVFLIYGEITQGSFQYSIPEDEPVTYRIDWKPGEAPPELNVGYLMASDDRIKKRRIASRY